MQVRRSLLFVAMVALALVLGQAYAAQPAAAQGVSAPPQVWSLGQGACMGDVCKSGPCTANDVRIASITTLSVVDPCTYIGDTGTYYFRARFVAGANTRYDPGVWIATDGGNAKTGACYSDYLIAPLTTTYTPPWGPPYWDAEANGDQCGDIAAGELNAVYRDIGPVTIQCTAGNTSGTINTCVAWDNQSDNNCPANHNCPGTGSKCNCEPSLFEVTLNQVDLRLVKAASVPWIPPGGEFDYRFIVSNTGNPCYPSTGYKISDNLPAWIKVRSLPAGCTTTPDSGETCYPNCNGYGDIVECTITTDLACGATAPALVLPVQLRMDAPPNVTNSACVTGFEADPVPGNNCGSITLASPTSVELLSFTATPAGRSVIVRWETASEVDTLGFNLYRAGKPGDPRTRVNEDLIPSRVYPGSPTGARYQYEELSRWPGAVAFYWLEDVDVYGRTELHGPVEVRAKK